MKKFLIFAVLFFVSVAPHALAQGFTALAPIPGLTDPSSTSLINSTSLANFFNNLYKYSIGAAATLATIMIIWGGIQYSTTDSIGNKEEGKTRIQEAILGLILVLAPVLVFTIINPSILNLSLNLPPIDLTVQTTSPTSGSCDPTTNADNAACRQQIIDACTSSGGTPSQTFDPISSKTTVRCDTSNSLAGGVTANACASLGNDRVTHTHDGIVYSSAANCASAPAATLNYARTRGQTCTDIVGGGFCIYTP